MTYLETILESKRKDKVNARSLSELETLVAENKRDIRPIVFSNTLDVIAEIKRKSPSKGHLANIDNPGELAALYETGGACLISVLTDKEFFGGSIEDLKQVRTAVNLPVLRKDFAIDLNDVYETYLTGADAMLLIVKAIEDVQLLKDMFELAEGLGMSVLVETHSEQEIEISQDIGSKIIGVNVRDLTTFEELPELGELLSNFDSDVIKVWESSILTLDDAIKARESGANAVLVGQGLVQSENPSDFIEQMRKIS